jgi:precorrin-2 dehydrogenase/sirohydrochlorin ferrochelatase
MRYYPIHLDIKNRNCLVVGGGTVGTLECGARVTVVSPNPTQQLTKLASEKAITLTRRAYRSADLDGAFLVIGATDDENLNQQISNDAALTNTLCNIGRFGHYHFHFRQKPGPGKTIASKTGNPLR